MSKLLASGIRLPVLLYHHVGPLRPGTFATLTVSPQKFRSQVEWLFRNGYQAITARDWWRCCSEGKELPKKPVLLTFDDGYEDLAEFAFPILKQHGFGATVFIVTSQIGGTNAWDQNNGSAAAHDLLNAEDILYWTRDGIEFGSHSVTHPDMTALSEQALDVEAGASSRELSAVLGQEVCSFAYPYGRMNAVVREAVNRNYRLAFTTEAGMNHLGSDLFSLKRTMVQSSDSLLDLRLRVMFGWNPFQEARRRIAQFRGRVPKTKELEQARVS
jgi:peptidoglycan/xylan/chitin deacetylase (PgdA/CDA1 family)